MFNLSFYQKTLGFTCIYLCYILMLMQRVSGGYTIVEVMIVLSITGALFLAASILFQGQQGKSEFSDANRDLQSKIQDWANDVTTGYYPSQRGVGGSTGYTCNYTGGGFSPNLLKLQYAPAGVIKKGTNEGCIYIGKVIQFKKDSGTVYSYTIVGQRQVTSAGGAPRLVESLEEATPFVARNTDPSGTAGINLTESYSVRWGALVQPTTSNPCNLNTSTCPTYTVAIYNSFGANAIGSTSSDSINMYQFPNIDFGNINEVDKCVNGGDPLGLPVGQCANTPLNLSNRVLKSWRICLKSAGSKQFATINLAPSGDSLSSQINYVNNC